MKNERKRFAESYAVVRAGFCRIAGNEQTGFALFSGDLVKNGERKSREELIKLQKAAKRR